MVDDIYNDSMLEGVLLRRLSISDWSAQGTCMCNGHASECYPTDGETSNTLIQVRNAYILTEVRVIVCGSMNIVIRFQQ